MIRLMASHFVLKNVRVFDGKQFGESTSLEIENGVISQNVSGAEQIDCEGGFLLPGFIDAHIHLNTVEEMYALARHGITTGLDMATYPPSKLQGLREAKQVGLPDFRSPGTPATSPGSVHSIILPLPEADFVSSPQDAVRFVHDRLSQGADYIKVIADVPGPDQATLNAIVAEAHRRGKLVVAHAATFIPFGMALDAGADFITHAPVDKALDEESCLRMAREGRVAIPTLTMEEAVTGAMSWTALLRMLLRPVTLFKLIQAMRMKRGGTPSADHAHPAPSGGGGKTTYENARLSVAALHRAGVPILAGTDAHEEPTSPFDVKHGASLHRELELLVAAGLSNTEVLQAATSLPAKHFGLSDRGAVELGMRADLVLLAQNPLDDITATRSIRRVWCAGVQVDV